MSKKKAKETTDNRDLLDRAVSEIRKEYGAGSIHAPHENFHIDKPVIATGIPQLDQDVLGQGGFVQGSVVEIFGIPGIGKSTLTLQIIAQAQKSGHTAVFIDMEHSLNTEYAARLGVDVDELYISQPTYMEEALGVLEALVRTGSVGIVVVDSLASLVPETEVEAEVGKETMGIQARKLSAWFRRFHPVISKTGTLVIFTNQLRDKVGSYMGGSTTPGGNAVKFYSSYRVEIRPEGQKIPAPGGNGFIGNKIKVTALKNRNNTPYRSTILTLIFGEGVDILRSTIEEAAALGIVIKSGAWYSINPDVLGEGVDPESTRAQGQAAFKELLQSNPELKDLVESKVKEFS